MIIKESRCCFNCLHFSDVSERCLCGPRIDRPGSNWCAHWTLNHKWTIAKEYVEKQVKLSQWNTHDHRKLEVL